MHEVARQRIQDRMTQSCCVPGKLQFGKFGVLHGTVIKFAHMSHCHQPAWTGTMEHIMEHMAT